MEPNNKLERFFESHKGHEFLGIIVSLNAVTLGLQTLSSIKQSSFAFVFDLMDTVFMSIFALELILRIYASGKRFFRNGWNLFDFFTISISLVPFGGSFSALRALRILRVTRLISLFPKMKIVVSSICLALPGIISVAGILLLSFYIASIIAVNLFSQTAPEHFGNLSKTLFTLFQLMLGDDWGATVRPLLVNHPYCYLFFIPFMLLMTFTVLNLFFGLIVNSMQAAAEEGNDLASYQKDSETLEDQIKDLSNQISELKNLICNK